MTTQQLKNARYADDTVGPSDLGDRLSEFGDQLGTKECDLTELSSSPASAASTTKGKLAAKGSFAVLPNAAFRRDSDGPKDGLSTWFSKHTESPGLCFLSPKAVLQGPSGAPVKNSSATLTDAFAMLELDDDAQSSGSGGSKSSLCSYDSTDDPGCDGLFLSLELDGGADGKPLAPSGGQRDGQRVRPY